MESSLDFDTGQVAIEQATRTLRIEAEAVTRLTERIGEAFGKAVGMLLGMKGRAVTTGIGKSGCVARKIASTLASTGTPAFFMHPAEAQHGDLGMVTRDDVVLMFSNSGETDELKAILPWLKRIGAGLIAFCGREESTLAREADVVLDVSVEREACPLGLAPTASALAAMAFGDALAMGVMAARGFTTEDYGRTHPAGALGRRILLRVSDIMHAGDENPTVPMTATVLDALLVMTNASVRGAVSVVDDEGRLRGLFTDGDFRVLMQREQDWAAVMRRAITQVMTLRPTVIAPQVLASEALRIMQERQFDNLPVVDEEGRAVGMLDIQDLMKAGVV
ncbi:MAG: KpsF/GutQ family sugar-phosphate isomerase [Armatimonadetes bacterium]|nr:KpsF/GutQ family sugar-phosphate isomerase [Armatimonadota bacterium]